MVGDGNFTFDPSSLIPPGANAGIYDIRKTDTLYQDAAATIKTVNVGDPIGAVVPVAGNIGNFRDLSGDVRGRLYADGFYGSDLISPAGMTSIPDITSENYFYYAVFETLPGTGANTCLIGIPNSIYGDTIFWGGSGPNNGLSARRRTGAATTEVLVLPGAAVAPVAPVPPNNYLAGAGMSCVAGIQTPYSMGCVPRNFTFASPSFNYTGKFAVTSTQFNNSRLRGWAVSDIPFSEENIRKLDYYLRGAYDNL